MKPRLKNAASAVKQSKLVFCVLLVRFIIQSVSNARTVNAFWMVSLLLRIPKKEPIASLATKNFILQNASNVVNQFAPNLAKRKHSVLSPWINLFTRHALFVRNAISV